MFRGVRRCADLPSSCFLFGCPFSRRQSLETPVRNRLAALDRAAVSTGGKAGLGTLDGGEVFAEIICTTLVELVLIEVGRQVGWVLLVRRLTGVLVPESRKRTLDPVALAGQEFASPLRIHQNTVAGRPPMAALLAAG